MFLRALLVIASGFIFIFSPGLPMSLISRYSPDYKRDLVYWGIGVWLIANLVNQFSSILLRMVMYQDTAASGFSGAPVDFLFVFLSALLSAVILSAGMLLVLRYKRKRNPEHDLLANGLALGFGAGLVAQVFTGITLIGAGFQILFGNSGINITTQSLAESNLLLVLASLLTLVLFRIALLAVNAVQGVLTAQSLITRKGEFWLGVLVLTFFSFLIIAIQLLIGGQQAGQVSAGITPTNTSLISGAYYLLAFIAAYMWLVRFLKIKK